jgi:hypothetical protein
MPDAEPNSRFKQEKPYHAPIVGGLLDAEKNCLYRKIKLPVQPTPATKARRHEEKLKDPAT